MTIKRNVGCSVIFDFLFSAVQQMMIYSEDIVNTKERNGFTALHFSALNDDVNTTRILLESVSYFTIFLLYFSNCKRCVQ